MNTKVQISCVMFKMVSVLISNWQQFKKKFLPTKCKTRQIQQKSALGLPKYLYCLQVMEKVILGKICFQRLLDTPE